MTFTNQLETELKTFEARKAELLGSSRERFALVHGADVVDVFVSIDDALKRGYELFGNNPFLVKQIVDYEVPQNFTSFQIKA